ncbi:uncharacterized protein OCT59_021580 [Rhizophagus irregularis]|uniref:Uncharacterized protein n=1 Tax=Rhizophagus irregularis TaxID=588596 RepID=A0A2I1ED13_9GLOM|nr:hypothetical protein RhiirB3_144449 [Rhizophagus irregularis]GBC16088.1 serine/threonine-protein phosphatase 5 [Rhizophagus irregularis DAOM 181602=DAOM 197198]UZO28036.1 hypothetical protein OCT59_021580 [Rhizophagus irregularis]CAB4495937.1 unnamed protein product [Rhizophagus irregularis]CAB5376767.1 unnamed protein product [Rhizophagus irregularis]
MPIDLLPISKLKHLDTILQTRIRQLNLIHHITKGYYRRAAANMNLCKFKDALRDFRIVMKRSPDDKDAKAKFTECEKS